ncbi:MAG: glycosyltransferase [Chloroflexota bacterium]
MNLPAHPIRIIYLIGQLGLGGSERQLYLLLKHMDKTRFDLHVVVFNPSPNYTLDDDLRKNGVDVIAIPGEVKGVRARTLWLYRLFRRLRPHVVHSWSIHDNAYAGVVGALARVPRRLGSVRGSLTSADFTHFPAHIRWLILHGVQGHLVNSEAIAAQMRNYGIPPHRIHVLTNCVETDSAQPAAQLDGIPSNARVVGMVGNLRREKNYPMFVRGLSCVLPEFPDVYGVAVGQPVMASDPEVPQQIQSEIASRGLTDRVKMLGFRADIPAALARFDIFCLTSDSEGTPNAILEAMSAGLPVIATRVGGIPRLVRDGESGFLVPPGDDLALVEALRALLRDPARAREMGAAGRARIEAEFGCDTIVRQFEEYYLKQFEK